MMRLIWQWAPALAVFAFVAFLVCWKISLIAVPDWGGDFERMRMEQVDRKNAQVCEKFGFSSGTLSHANCKLDLQEVRAHDRGLSTF